MCVLLPCRKAHICSSAKGHCGCGRHKPRASVRCPGNTTPRCHMVLCKAITNFVFVCLFLYTVIIVQHYLYGLINSHVCFQLHVQTIMYSDDVLFAALRVFYIIFSPYVRHNLTHGMDLKSPSHVLVQ